MDLIKYYSNKKVQEILLKTSKNREITARFQDSFGKRPDILQFESDILEFAKKGATSFHLSEEHWSNPLMLKSGMTQSQLNELRTGWDLILDIDGPLKLSKIVTYLIIEALEFNDIKNYGIKFSGNKGFHIIIPFKAFPKKIPKHNIETKNSFPESPKIIASYLSNIIEEKGDERLSKFILKKYSIKEILEMTNKKKEDITYKICKKCNVKAKEGTNIKYICNKCEIIEEGEDKRNKVCPYCKNIREEIKKKIIECPKCGENNKNKFEDGKFNPFSVVEIDTLLISNRHMFRAPYSYHEKSKLISIPIRKKDVLGFDKKNAKPENIKFNIPFLKECKEGEASRLIEQAFSYEFDRRKREPKKEIKIQKQYSDIKQKISMDLFPSSIKKGLLGLEDGRKRFLFVLLNFLRSLNYNYEEMEKIVESWNKKNNNPLREGYVKSQLMWHKRQKKILPPNYMNKIYYDDIGLKPKENELKFKNPVNYSLSLFKAKRR